LETFILEAKASMQKKVDSGEFKRPVSNNVFLYKNLSDFAVAEAKFEIFKDNDEDLKHMFIVYNLDYIAN